MDTEILTDELVQFSPKSGLLYALALILALPRYYAQKSTL